MSCTMQHGYSRAVGFEMEDFYTGRLREPQSLGVRSGYDSMS